MLKVHSYNTPAKSRSRAGRGASSREAQPKEKFDLASEVRRSRRTGLPLPKRLVQAIAFAGDPEELEVKGREHGIAALEEKIGKIESPATGNERTKTKLPRGPRPNMEYHRAIAAVVNPYGDNWRTESNLGEIAVELDRDKAKTPPPKAWANRRPPTRSWWRAFQNFKELVIKKISYSLQMAARDSSDKTLGTLSNSR